MGLSPRAPSVVSRTCEPKPTGRTQAYFLSSAQLRAPIRLLSTRAPRQAVLRASFRLAPCLAFVTRPCDLPTDKTRDASDRLLPPVRTACTRTSCASGVPAASFPAWAPHRVWARCGLTGGPSVFTTPEPLWWIDRTRRSPECCLRSLSPPRFGFRLGDGGSVGVFFPRSPRTTVPLTSLSPLPLPPAVSPTFAVSSITSRCSAGARGLQVWRSRQDHRDRLLVKVDGS